VRLALTDSYLVESTANSYEEARNVVTLCAVSRYGYWPDRNEPARVNLRQRHERAAGISEPFWVLGFLAESDFQATSQIFAAPHTVRLLRAKNKFDSC
jgi:hypothetical protein